MAWHIAEVGGTNAYIPQIILTLFGDRDSVLDLALGGGGGGGGGGGINFFTAVIQRSIAWTSEMF